MRVAILGKLVRTYHPLAMGAWIFGVAFLYGLYLYLVFPNEIQGSGAIVGAVKFCMFLLGGYSLIQSRYRGVELDLRRNELKRAQGDSEALGKINLQLERIKQDKRTGDNFLVIAFLLGIILFLVGRF
tara:strand:- start:1428 stop:1811 length:384 start_codon:yes stop_codon:yes gene_type:complete